MGTKTKFIMNLSSIWFEVLLPEGFMNLIMASLIISAAVPCIGELMAFLSANPRT
jgi:hypothetical protein